MKRKIIDFVLNAALYFCAFVFVLPCFLIFSEGEDGNITVWNFVGLCWLLVVCWVVGLVAKES